MKINRFVKSFVLCAVLALAAFKVTAGHIDTQRAVEPGVWTSDYYGAMEYAEANNIPLFLFWANNGCSHCEAVEKEMNKEPFLSWMAERKLVMVFIESDSTVKKWIKKNAPSAIKAFPFAAVYWPSNTQGVEVLEGFSAYKGNMSQYGASSKTSNTQQIMDTVDFLIPDWDPNGVVPAPDPVFYTVNFVVDAVKGAADGELSQQVESGKDAVAPIVTANEGWEFTGWDKSFGKVTSDLTVNAKFSAVVPDPDPVFYTVNFVVDADKGVATGDLTQQVESGKGAVAPAVAANEGWEFVGWDKSFSKVKSDLTVTAMFEQPVEREEIDPAVFFKKARTIQAVATMNDELFGRATITLGKYNTKKKTLKATFKIVSFAGKTFSKSLTVSPDEYGDFLVDAPIGVVATVKNGSSLNFGAAPKLKYNRIREDGETWYELAEFDEDRYPNLNAVKITYKPATGVFSGSFSLYASNEYNIDEGKKPTLKAYKAKVSGYVVNGVGVGTVSVKVGRKTYVGACSLE